jgi:intein/homing endonuclease
MTTVQYNRPWLADYQTKAFFNDKRYSLIEATAQPLDTYCQTPEGTRLFGELKIGDSVFTCNGSVTKVIGVYPLGERDVYELTFSDGVKTRACGQHLWEVSHYRDGKKILTTDQLIKNTKSLSLYRFPVCEAVKYPKREFAIDPWLVGVLIGDGYLCGNALGFSSADIEIVERVKKILPSGYSVIDAGNYNYRIIASKRGAGYEKPCIRFKANGYEVYVAKKYIGRTRTKKAALALHSEAMTAHYGSDVIHINLRQELRKLGLLGKKHNTKFIPDVYKYNSSEVRLEILRGILDTDGSSSKYNGAVIEQTSKKLSDDIEFLVKSLGGFAKTVYTKARNEKWKDSYRTNIRAKEISRFFWLPRKKNKSKLCQGFVRKLVNIIPVGKQQVQCISVAHKSQLYLTDDFIVTHNTKAGKAQPYDALISTPHGWVRMGDLRIGDIVHGRFGNSEVRGIYPQGKRATFRVSFADGSVTLASDEHLWSVHNSLGKERILTTAELAKRPLWDLHRAYIPQHHAVEYESSEIPIDAWLLGFLTGDGGFTTTSLKVSIDVNEKEVIERVRTAIKLYDCVLHYDGRSDWIVKKPKDRPKEQLRHPLIQRLRDCSLWGLYSDEKFAPDFIKFGSIKTRLAYIQGLFDADGYVNKHGQPSIEQTSKKLADDITHIIRSLGGIVRNSNKANSYKNKDGVRISAKHVYRQYIAIDSPASLFTLARKKNKCRILKKPVKRTFRSIKYVGMQDCQCITVSAPDKLYLTDDYIVTHNTVGGISWLLERSVYGKAGQNRWWVAPVYPQAKIAYTRMKRAIPRELFEAHDTDLKITLANGAIIWFKSGEKPDNLYGEDVYDAVIDEASRMREESWHAIRSTLTATRGFIRIIGNVRGRQNWAYKLARKAESGELDTHYAKITAYDAIAAGILKPEEIEDAKRTLPEQVFRELYLAEPSDDGGNPFGLSAIEACIAHLSENPVEAWGVDLAKSLDYTVCIGLDSKGAVARFERWQAPWEDTIRRVRALVGNDSALVDSTGVGDAVLEALQKDGQVNFEGYKFSSPSKQQLMEGLAVVIQNKEISYPQGVIVSELQCYEYEYTRTGVRYCMVPETKILTKDLHWRSLSKTKIGDEILAFDEYPIDGEKTRNWQVAKITHHNIIKRPCYDIILEDGTKLTASKEHLWLVDVGNPCETGGKHQWIRTDELRGVHPTSKSPRFAPHHLSKILEVWEEDKSYEAGYLAGVFDGEGHISQQSKHNGTGNSLRIGFAQRENAVARVCREYLKKFNFDVAESKNGGGTHKDVFRIDITGRRDEVVRFLGQIRPKRLLDKFDAHKLGTFTKKEKVKIIRIEYIGEREVIALGTSTHTFVAEGYATHNSAPEGLHDDCVCALALAVRKLKAAGVGDNILAYYRNLNLPNVNR